jgi:hypothetical protein
MTAIRIETTIDSDTLYLPELKPLLGKSVEIVVREMPQTAGAPTGTLPANTLVGSVVRYDEPCEPALSPNDWEAGR